MQPLDSADYCTLDAFPLLWRWTSPQHDILPARVLDAIKPLRAEAAKRLTPEAERRGLPKPAASYRLSIDTDGDDAEPVRRRLAELGIPSDTAVVVHWDDATAVLCPWGVFLAYWDAFCYPSSDDVTVWSPGVPWTLNYRHFEVFEFDQGGGAV